MKNESILFLFRKGKEQFEQSFPPSPHGVTYNAEKASSLPWQTVILLSKFELASSILFFALSMSRNISRVFFNMKIFLPASLPLRHLHPFPSPSFLIYVDEFVFIEFFWLHMQGSLDGSIINIPTVSYFFCNSIYI